MAAMFARCLLISRTQTSELLPVVQRRLFSQPPAPITGIATSGDTIRIATTGDITEQYEEFSKLPAHDNNLAQTLLHTKLKSPSITTLTELVKYSTDLQEIVALGVSLREVEEQDGAPDLLANVKYYPHVHDIVALLKAVGVEEIGGMITKCPFILGVEPETIKLKLVYLSSRRFSRSQIAKLITKQPKWLLESLTEVDAKLGAVQQVFHLSNKELRDVVSRCPKIARVSTLMLQQFKYIMSDAYDCDRQMLKKIVMNCPAAAYVDELSLRERMDYLTQTMQLSVAQVATWPSILRCRQRILKERHLVLSQVNMAQYDNAKPGYVSLQRLVSGKDKQFCEEVAKIPLQLYHDYLKTF